MPSASPTLTGQITSVKFTGVATSELSDSELAALESELEGIFGVPVSVDDPQYTVSGSFFVDPVGAETENDIIAFLAETLGIHEKDINVAVNPFGEVSYTITSDAYADAEANRNTLQNTDFDVALDEITVTEETVNSDIGIETSLAVDVGGVVLPANFEDLIYDAADSYALNAAITRKNSLFSNLISDLP